MWSRLLACTILVGSFAAATISQAQVLDERFTGGAAPRPVTRVALRTTTPPAPANTGVGVGSFLTRLLGGFSGIGRTTVSYPGNHASAELLTLGHERGRIESGFPILGGGEDVQLLKPEIA